MKLAIIGPQYQIEPVAGIDEVIYSLKGIFNIKKPMGVAFTYSINPDIIDKLASICNALRVFAARAPTGMMRGAYVTTAQIHYKGILMWDNEITVSYIGSSNLAMETGGNYGLLIIKQGSIDRFDTKLGIKNYNDWNDPIEVIVTDIITRETGGRCEICNKPVEYLYLNDNARFVCEVCGNV